MAENTVKINPEEPVPTSFGTTSWLYGKDNEIQRGENDDIFNKIHELSLLSPTQASCNDTIRKYLIGNGWYNEKPKTPKSFIDWAKSINNQEQTLNDFIEEVFQSLQSLGNVYIEIVRFTYAGEKHIYPYVLPTLQCKLIDSNGNGHPTHVIQKRGKRKSPKLPIYRDSKTFSWLNDEIEIAGVKTPCERAAIFIANKKTGVEYYGVPNSISAITQQLMEYKISRINLDQIENGIVLSGVLSIPSDLSAEEAQAITRNLFREHSGDGKRHRIITIAALDSDKVKFTPTHSQREGEYTETLADTIAQIYKANNWSPILNGESHKGSLGGTQYIKELYDIKLNTFIIPHQKFILEKCISPIIKIIAAWKNVQWALDLRIKNEMPFSILNGIPIGKAITINEVRRKIGLEELDDPKIGNTFIEL